MNSTFALTLGLSLSSLSIAMETHNHQNEHGGQLYTEASFDQSWHFTKNGNAEFHSDNQISIGSDENKFVLKFETEKPESERTEYDLKLLYSRLNSDFWDLQIGLGYQTYQIHIDDVQTSQDYVTAIVGVEGLAAYFFETSAYLSIGKNEYAALNIEAERDFLITQKLILQPYLELDVILNDNSKYAEKSGVHEGIVGLETRYEVSKQFMPYINIAYRYEQETEWENSKQKSHSEKNWIYGFGLRFEF